MQIDGAADVDLVVELQRGFVWPQVAVALTQNGTYGAYAFASQRLWHSSGEGDARGVSGFIQFGINDSRTMIATRYLGLGVTAFGLIPGRPMDLLGAGIAWSRLNRAGLPFQSFENRKSHPA